MYRNRGSSLCLLAACGIVTPIIRRTPSTDGSGAATDAILPSLLPLRRSSHSQIQRHRLVILPRPDLPLPPRLPRDLRVRSDRPPLPRRRPSLETPALHILPRHAAARPDHRHLEVRLPAHRVGRLAQVRHGAMQHVPLVFTAQISAVGSFADLVRGAAMCVDVVLRSVTLSSVLVHVSLMVVVLMHVSLVVLMHVSRMMVVLVHVSLVVLMHVSLMMVVLMHVSLVVLMHVSLMIVVLVHVSLVVLMHVSLMMVVLMHVSLVVLMHVSLMLVVLKHVLLMSVVLMHVSLMIVVLMHVSLAVVLIRGRAMSVGLMLAVLSGCSIARLVVVRWPRVEPRPRRRRLGRRGWCVNFHPKKCTMSEYQRGDRTSVLACVKINGP